MSKKKKLEKIAEENIELLSGNFSLKSEIERELEIIDKFYPGIDKLTANEVALFGKKCIKNLHDYHFKIAVRRCCPHWYNDTSKIIGTVKKEKVKKKKNTKYYFGTT